MLEYNHLNLEWTTNEINLPAVDLTIALNPNIRICYLGATNLFDWEKHDDDGTCIGQDNFCEHTYDLLIGHKPGLAPPFYSLFTQGHEEGHLLNYISGLERLHQETERAGFAFKFFSRWDCKETDQSAEKVHSQTNSYQDFKRVWKKDPELKEAIANIAGLVSLVKGRFPDHIIKEIHQKIKQGNLRPLEDLLADKEETKKEPKKEDNQVIYLADYLHKE